MCSRSVECVLVVQNAFSYTGALLLLISERDENTFYTKRTHSTQREHILHQKNTFYTKRTHSTPRERIALLLVPIAKEENTFYTIRTHSTLREHILLPIAKERRADAEVTK